MMTLPSTITVPLQQKEDGSIRVGNTRVLLELVIHAFQRGESPEGIVDSYITLRLDDVYAVLAYYLQNQEIVNDYLETVQFEADVIRHQIEAKQANIQSIRARLKQQLKNNPI